MVRFALVSGAMCLAAGCTSIDGEELRTKPSNVGVEEALTQIGAGFAGMRAELKGVQPIGISACKVTVALNVTGSVDEEDKLVVDLSATAPEEIAEVKAEIEGEAGRTVNVTRGNTINIELYNAACLPPGTLGHDKPEKLDSIREVFNDDSTIFNYQITRPSQ